VSASAGLSDKATTVASLHESYQDASIALRLGVRLDNTVSSINDLRIHQLLTAAGHRPRVRLRDGLIATVRAQPDWPALRQTFIVWCESGFNLVHAACALHLHRNTLIYRLNKIARLTGRPVRDFRGALALYLACLADQLGDEEPLN
jgi:carbohydrate diacid regulator